MKRVVIGAGLAGLTAGLRLDADVYEARGRVGGRVLSAEVNGRAVELGGQNIADGGDAPNLRALIAECGLKTTSEKFPLNFSYFDGEKLLSETDALHGFNPERLVQAAKGCRTIEEVLAVLFGKGSPLYHSLGLRMAAYEGGDADRLCISNIDTLHYMLVGGLSPVHRENVAMSSVVGGNSRLAEALAERLGPRLHLNSPLRAIARDGRFKLVFDEGVVEADEVVLSVPTSVYADIDFAPGLIPEERFEQMGALGYGQNAKILIPAPNLKRRHSYVGKRSIAWNDTTCGVVTLYYAGAASHLKPETYQLDRPLVQCGFNLEPPEEMEFAKDALGHTYSGPVGHSWPDDPFAKGSYTYVQAGQEKLATELTEVGGVKVKKLFTPIDGLYFAGEHTSTDLDAMGTMEAAVESGENVARLMEFYSAIV